MIRRCLILFCLLAPVATFASEQMAEKVFTPSVKLGSANKILLHFSIKKGYHIYRNHFHFQLLSPNTAILGKIYLPPGKPTEDNIFGKYQIYVKPFVANITVHYPGARDVNLKVTYQGCSDEGTCYPPISKVVTVNFNQHTAVIQGAGQGKAGLSLFSNSTGIAAMIASHSFLWVLLAFFGFGILLAFTPCILPMIPILSSIIVGQSDRITAIQGFFLALAYVLGMAITYAVAGVIAGLIGSSVQAFFQSPIFIILFSLLFVVLAISLFGAYELQLPSALRDRLTSISQHQKAGNYFGVAIIGCFSALIVSPCVSAPLIGALAYIGKTGNAVLGGFSLFCLGLGMGVPLLVFGAVGGKLLPKAGSWMSVIKVFFGFVLLAVTVFLLSRILSFRVILLLNQSITAYYK